MTASLLEQRGDPRGLGADDCHGEALQRFNPFIALHDSQNRGEEHVGDAVCTAGTEKVDRMFYVAALEEMCEPFFREDSVQDVQLAKDGDTSDE